MRDCRKVLEGCHTSGHIGQVSYVSLMDYGCVLDCHMVQMDCHTQGYHMAQGETLTSCRRTSCLDLLDGQDLCTLYHVVSSIKIIMLTLKMLRINV